MGQCATDEMSDQSLMLAVREGDIEKLGVLFERYNIQLFNFLFRLTGDRHLSEDLVQELFVRILRYRHTYKRERSFSTWMFQIARNIRIDHFRASTGEETCIEDQSQELVSSDPTPVESVEQRERIRLLLNALAMLPGKRREVLPLRGFQGMKFEEIAEVSKCSVNTVKARAFKAIRELRDAMQQLQERSVV